MPRPPPRAQWLLSAVSSLMLAGFLVFHLVEYAVVAASHEPAERLFTWRVPGPLRLAGSLLLVWVPLLYHAVRGLRLLQQRTSRPLPPEAQPWVSWVARTVAAGTFVFVVLHVMHVQAPLWLGDRESSDVVPHLIDSLSSTTASGVPLAALLHLIGAAIVAAHVGMGAHALVSAAPPSNAAVPAGRAKGWSVLAGSVLFILAAGVVVTLATGGLLP